MRTVQTTSGATAVQIVWSSRRGSREIGHLGSAHDEAGLEALKAAAQQRIAAGQVELDLGEEIRQKRTDPARGCLAEPDQPRPGGKPADQTRLDTDYRTTRADCRPSSPTLGSAPPKLPHKQNSIDQGMRA